MTTIRSRFSEPQFISILGGTMFLWFAIGLTVVAQRVNEGAAEIQASTGVIFWPTDPAKRFNWNFMYGNPWIALAAGSCAGILLGLWMRSRERGRRDQWVNDTALIAKGVRVKKRFGDFFWLPILILTELVPAFALSIFFQFSGVIYLNAATAFISFTRYSQIRLFRLQVNERLANEVLTNEEKQSVEKWHSREKKALRSMYRWLMFYGVLLIVGTIFYAAHVDRVMAEAEQTILDKQNDR